MNFAKSLFSFALDNEYLEKNPVVPGLIPPKKKNPRKRRDTFSLSDLKAIFEKAKFFKFCNSNPHRFWLPVLALFAGCRLEEMAQLYVGDVYQIEGLWVLDINADDEKQVKNEASKRRVPQHPILIDDLKFHKFVRMIKGKGKTRVFQELTKRNNKYGHKFSKDFGAYKKGKLGFDMKKTFHSFRHTVNDLLYKKLVNLTLMEEFMGRSPNTEGSKTYAKGHYLESLYEEVVLKIEYGVDLSHLKQGKYVPK